MILFETPGATAAFWDGSPLVLIFKAAAVLKGWWWLDSQIVVDPLHQPFGPRPRPETAVPVESLYSPLPGRCLPGHVGNTGVPAVPTHPVSHTEN